MKLRNKIFIIIGFLWALFLGLNYFSAIHDSLVNFAALCILFAGTMCALIHLAVIRREELLYKQLEEISLKNNLVANNDTKDIPPSWLTHYDKLTSLPDHLFFNETLNKAISHTKRRNKLLAVLLVEVTIPTSSRNTHHTDNDYIIQEASKRISSTLRTEDVLVKLEGNAFNLLLNDINKAKFASSVANKILQALATPINAGGQEIVLTTHIGICVYPTEGTSLEDLLKNADVALSKAKNAGMNTFRFYTQAMDAEASEYVHMEKSLHRAISNHELTLYYQPKLHLKTGSITRIEALVRWVDPEIGVINPEKFLPIAEETGMIHTIGEWALREACKVNKQWQNEGYMHMPIAINLSPKQFYHPHISKMIASALEESGLNPNYLELEITETAMMDDAGKASKILADIKETGVQISIDHFGAGYFSISQLKQFPLTLLKIDQSFIKGVPQNPNDAAITAAIISLAHNLGLEVVAEGVETAEQVQFLSSQNCDMVQGYFLSQPLPADQIVLQFKKLMEGVLL